MSDRDINIGGNSIGSTNTTGDNNVVFTSYQKVTLPAPETVDINATLAALREALGELTLKGSDFARISKSLDEAEQEAQSDEPDKQSIGSHVEKALDIAKTANGFVDTCKELGPHVASAASWLGENWYKLLPLVGYAL
jgi:hypothetical protein